MNILVTGSSGLVGKALMPYLITAGHSAVSMVRGRDWDPVDGSIRLEVFDDVDAVVHLAGDPIADGRWTKAKKKRIRDSRVNGTRLICAAMANRDQRPRILIAASAIGYYGDRRDEELTEQSRQGRNFLAEICSEWERATQVAADNGVRVVNLRLGVVLSTAGGGLTKMLLPFRMGGGGILGDGSQYMSWIALDDVLGAIHHALMTEAISGPVNAVTPNPVTNTQFTKTLGAVLNRPTVVPMPAFAARLAFGQMADELLLASAQVTPEQLQATGYTFHLPDLEAALRHVLRRA